MRLKLPRCSRLRCGPTYQIVHVSPGKHVCLHVGVLVKERVQKQRRLVGPLLLTQCRVQAVEIDLERVRLLRGQRRRVYVRGETLLTLFYHLIHY